MNVSRTKVWDAIVRILQEQMADRGLQRDDFMPSVTMDEVGVSSLDAMNLMVTLEEDFQCRLGFQDTVSRDGVFLGSITLLELLELVTDKILAAGGEEAQSTTA